MLKKSLETYQENIFKELDIKNAILTSGDKSTGFNCLTVSWGGLGNIWGKHVAFLFVRHTRYTFQFLEKSDSVTLSVLDEDYKDAVLYLGTHSGRDEDKVQKTGLSYCYDPDFDGAYIAQSSYCFKMKKLYHVDLPYESLPKEIKEKYYKDDSLHRMYVCEIKQFLVKEE